MPRETVKKSVDGVEYEFSQYGAERSLKMLIRISKIVGEPLAIAMASATGQGPVAERQVDPLTLASAVKALFSRLDEGEAIQIIKQLSSEDCLCEGRKIDFNLHYEQRLPHLFKVVKAALEVQYGNFLDALSGLAEGLLTPTSTTPDKQA